MAREENQREYIRSLRMEQSWRQKSRCSWLKEEDSNTRFIHKLVDSHTKMNSISKLLADNEWETNMDRVKATITYFYKSLYHEPFWRRPRLESLVFNQILKDKRDCLERPFTKQEVYGLPEDKALGLDGFPIKFFKVFWPPIGKDIMKALEEFHHKTTLCRKLNSTFVVLIPKIVGAIKIKDFRPIVFSRISTIYWQKLWHVAWKR